MNQPRTIRTFPRLKVTMQSLVYPAFLGSMLFGFFQRVSNSTASQWGRVELLGLIILVYFGTL